MQKYTNVLKMFSNLKVCLIGMNGPLMRKGRLTKNLNFALVEWQFLRPTHCREKPFKKENTGRK